MVASIGEPLKLEAELTIEGVSFDITSAKRDCAPLVENSRRLAVALRDYAGNFSKTARF